MHILCILFLSWLLVFPSSAVMAKEVLVQTEHFKVPLLTDSGRIKKGLVTLYITFSSETHVINFCNILPKVREAVLVTANRNPIRVSDNEYRLEGVSSLYKQALREAFVQSGIKKVVVIRGTKKKAEGSESLVIRGVRRKCTPLKTTPQFVVKAELLDEASQGFQAQNKASRFEGPVQDDLVNPYGKGPSQIKRRPEQSIDQSDIPKTPVQSPASASKTKNLPKIGVVGLQPKTVPTPVPAQTTDKVSNTAPVCSSNMGSFWEAGEYDIAGQSYWLKRVYTIDRNNDRRVDDIGFNLVRNDGSSALDLYYYGAPGQKTITMLPGLKLNTEGVISRFCPGEITFPIPFQNETSETKRSLSKANSNPASVRSKKEDDSMMQLVMVVAGISLVVVVLVGILVMQIRKSSKQNRLQKRMSENRVAEGLSPEGPASAPRINIEENFGESASLQHESVPPEPLSEKRKRRIEARNRRKEKDKKS